VRTSGNPEAFTSAIRQASMKFDSGQVVYDFTPMTKIVSDSIATQRFTMILLEIFSGLALVLSSVGIYGVISYLVGQRTHEIGIRMALGAQRRDVVRMVLGEGLRVALLGVVVGIVAALGLTRLLTQMIFGVRTVDPLLVKAYQTGQDIHTLTAAEVFGIPAETMSKETRNRAKAVNFGIVYGISPFGLAAQLGIDQHEARLYIETYFERYAGVRAYIDRMLEETRREQKVRTMFGRVRPIPDIQSRNANQRGFAERTAINTPLQGTAADLIKLAMIRIDQRLAKEKLQSRMTLQVHDELVFDVPEDEVAAMSEMVQHEMEHVVELSVPLVADVGVGANWRDL